MENLVLRRQIQELTRARTQHRFSACFQAFCLLVRRIWPRWKESLVIVKPGSVVAWHRKGFKLFWRWKSRKQGGRRTRKELIALIRRMAAENPW